MDHSILRGKDITLRYNNKIILDSISISLPKNKIIGLVGKNGSGKSSLLRILAGSIECDEGEITKSKTTTISYVPQSHTKSEYTSIGEYFNHSFGTEEEYLLYRERLEEYRKHFFYFSDDQSYSTLSGGELRQLSILKHMSIQPDILLLDEPTNHLDLKTIITIQTLFKHYPSTIMIISHDRYFLDSCVDSIWELDEGKLFTHKGTYSDFVIRKNKRRADQTQLYLQLKQEFKREHEWFASGVKARGTKDSGRLKRYYELKTNVAKTKPRWKDMMLPIPKPPILGAKILNITDLSVDFTHNKKPLITSLSLQFSPKMRLGLLGANGSGKTTLLKTILSEYPKKSGKISIGLNTKFNYHDQHRDLIANNSTVLHCISEGAMEIEFGLRKMNVYSYLRKFLITKEDSEHYTNTLSGGEKARLLLAKILKQGGNFLILDEPTNDLDLDTIQSLENTLLQFDGCLICVSHDRFFLDSICTHILALEGDGKYTLSSGGYSRYIKRYAKENDYWHDQSAKTPKSDDDTIQKNQTIELTQPKKQEGAKKKLSTKEVRSIKAQIRIIESQLDQLSQRIKSSQTKMEEQNYYSRSYDKIMKDSKNLTLLIEEKKKFETRWIELSEIID